MIFIIQTAKTVQKYGYLWVLFNMQMSKCAYVQIKNDLMINDPMTEKYGYLWVYFKELINEITPLNQ
jgi:hypothetical protein